MTHDRKGEGMEYRVALKGSGRAELAAYGMADAEHQVEKEIRRTWPEAVVEVLDVARTGTGHIVEEFAVRYRLAGLLQVSADDPAAARTTALRDLRSRFAGTRHSHIEWDPACTS